MVNINFIGVFCASAGLILKALQYEYNIISKAVEVSTSCPCSALRINLLFPYPPPANQRMGLGGFLSTAPQHKGLV